MRYRRHLLVSNLIELGQACFIMDDEKHGILSELFVYCARFHSVLTYVSNVIIVICGQNLFITRCLLLYFNLVGRVHKSRICKYFLSRQVASLTNEIFRAMINELTHKDGERVALNSYRYAWTVISNIFVYAMASVLLGVHSSADETDISFEH